MVIVQSADLERDRRRLAGLGVRIVWQITLDDIATIHLHPRDVGGAIVSIDQPRPAESWRWGGPEWPAAVRTDVVDGIRAVTIGAREPARLAARWAAVLDVPETRAHGREPALRLEEHVIRFVPADTDEGLVAVELAARDAAAALASARTRGLHVAQHAVTIGGVRFDLR
jgi:hypothetical protein